MDWTKGWRDRAWSELDKVPIENVLGTVGRGHIIAFVKTCSRGYALFKKCPGASHA